MRRKQPLLKRRIVVIPLVALLSLVSGVILAAVAWAAMYWLGASPEIICLVTSLAGFLCGLPGGLFVLSILDDSRYDASWYR